MKNNSKKSVTMVDVANHAGVSIKTVSRVVNDDGYVSDATRQRVQSAIISLDYRPNRAAQLLASKRHITSGNIALLFPHKYPKNLPYNSLDMDFIIGAAVSTGEQGCFFSLVTAPVTEDELLGYYQSKQVDGLILMQIHTDDWRVNLLREQGYPFVMIGHTDDNTGLSFIDLDFTSAVVCAFNELIDLGHRKIGFLALPETMHKQGYGPAQRGWLGYQQVLENNGIQPLYREVSYTGQEMFTATLELLEEAPDLTAIVTTHTFAATSIMHALSTMGRTVPDDISLIGLMSEKISEMASPAVTYIDFPSYSMGYRAAEMLINILGGESETRQQILIPPRLVTRNSTIPYRS